MKKNQGGDSDDKKNTDGGEVTQSRTHQSDTAFDDSGSNQKTDSSAAKCVPEAFFIAELFLHKENRYADKERPVDYLNGSGSENVVASLIDDIPKNDPGKDNQKSGHFALGRLADNCEFLFFVHVDTPF